MGKYYWVKIIEVEKISEYGINKYQESGIKRSRFFIEGEWEKYIEWYAKEIKKEELI